VPKRRRARPLARRQRRRIVETKRAWLKEYVDLRSGWRDAERRPAFQRLMADAAAGRFEAVIVYHSSRFARNQVLARRYKTLLRENGIVLVSAKRERDADGTRRRAIQGQLEPAIDLYLLGD
jgi:DNA invertase Pin-like site-specific DNA recombinase